MIVPQHIQSYFDSQVAIFNTVDEILNDWKGTGCFKLPMLLDLVAEKLDWDEKMIRAKDPVIRDYLRNNPYWHITRGAHGGIMRADEKEKKEAIKSAKEQAKADVNEAIEKEIERRMKEKLNNPISVATNISSTKLIDYDESDEYDDSSPVVW